MNLSKLKSYAPQARRDFIQAVKDRAGFYGLAEARIEPIVERGEIAVILGREHPRSVASKRRALEERIRRDGFKQTMESLAYTWFNRFVAIRFMELHEYLDHGLRVLSHPAGKTTPEILEKAHLVDLPGLKKDVVIDLKLAGDKDQELYRRLLVAQCNALHEAMPFLFERIGDETELLLPDNLLNTDSLVRKLIAAIDEDDWKEVEIIGWLYQFYISEKKDEVFAGLKKNQKIAPENIPAATQLFTPHWIVRYLVENSLGRLWLLNRPDSRLAENMPYYIAPAEPETDFIRIASPEEIKVCDPACGSGHMLTYAFDLLCEIYQEAGYPADEIAPKILANNLVGIEIDDRAGALAAFALAMKAAAKLGARQFLRLPVKPAICVLQNVRFAPGEMRDVAAFVGRELFTAELQATLAQFEQAKNFGSLIVPKLQDPAEVARVVLLKDFGGDLLLRGIQERMLNVLKMAGALTQKYNLVVANPPYMGGGGMNENLKEWAKVNYSDSKSDSFAMFINRCVTIGVPKSFVAMVTIQKWMFTSSFEKIRREILNSTAIRGLLQIGFNSFPELNSKYALAVAFILHCDGERLKGTYLDLNDAPHAAKKDHVFREKIDSNQIYQVDSARFLSIPCNKILYSFSDKVYSLFDCGQFVSDCAEPASGLQTNDISRFLRLWTEVQFSRIGFGIANRSEAKASKLKWFPHVKGGPYRKWYGNLDYVVNWENDGEEIFALATKLYGAPTRTVKNLARYFQSAATWTDISAGQFGVRKTPAGSVFDTSAPSLYAHNEGFFISLLNSRPAEMIINTLCPSLHYLANDISSLPLPAKILNMLEQRASQISESTQNVSKVDWDAYETSWDFATLPLLSPDHCAETLETTYAGLRAYWRREIKEMRRLEEENNRVFIDAYGLQDELTHEGAKSVG
jgi:Eco57I restriction-modification methylase